MQIITNSAEETIILGKKIGSILKKGSIIALDGVLAAGKTYFTKGIAEGLNIKDEITSPTFTLISEYHGTLPLYHFDVYRLSSAEEFLDLGAEEFLYGNGVCVIEWAEKVKQELPAHTVYIKIELDSSMRRVFTIEPKDDKMYQAIYALIN